MSDKRIERARQFLSSDTEEHGTYGMVSFIARCIAAYDELNSENEQLRQMETHAPDYKTQRNRLRSFLVDIGYSIEMTDYIMEYGNVYTIEDFQQRGALTPEEIRAEERERCMKIFDKYFDSYLSTHGMEDAMEQCGKEIRKERNNNEG